MPALPTAPQPKREHKMSIKFLSPRQTCEHVTVSRSTLDRLVAAGEFPKPIRITERRLAYVESEVAAWLEAKVSERTAA
jgi:predicted DNA-binding transcriptional regulator AlpA